MSWGIWQVPQGSLGGSWVSLGGSEVSLWVAVCATDRVVMYTACLVSMFVISLRLWSTLTHYKEEGLPPPPLTDTVNSI